MEREGGGGNIFAGNIMLHSGCLKWLLVLTNPADLKRNTSTRLFGNDSTFYSDIIDSTLP